jgi:hypothetical protein
MRGTPPRGGYVPKGDHVEGDLIEVLEGYFSNLRARIRAHSPKVSERAVAREAGMLPQHLTNLMNRTPDVRVSTVLRLERAYRALLNREAGK